MSRAFRTSARRIGIVLAAAAAFLAASKPGAARDGTDGVVPHGIDTEHLFGFTEGSDIGIPGERELESETTGRFGRRGGRFRAIDTSLALKVPLSEWFRIAPGVALARYDITGVPGLTDRTSGNFNGAFLETRFRLLDRASAPFGLTLNVVPSFARVDPGTGFAARTYGSEFGLLADREIIPGQLVAALNLGYGIAALRPRGTNAVVEGSGTEVAIAVAYQIRPGLFLGGEVRYLRAYGGLGLDRFAGHAAYLGPTLYTALSDRAWASFTWSTQVAGRAQTVPGGLDLTNFDRHQMRLRVGYSF